MDARKINLVFTIGKNMDNDEYYLWGYETAGINTEKDKEKDKDHKNRQDIIDCKQKIRDLESSGMISKNQQMELDLLNKKIVEIQAGCFHDFEIVVLFQLNKRFCKKCDFEDLKYNHFAK